MTGYKKKTGFISEHLYSYSVKFESNLFIEKLSESGTIHCISKLNIRM